RLLAPFLTSGTTLCSPLSASPLLLRILRPLKINRAYDIIGQIDQSDIRPSSLDSYRADTKAVHAIRDVREDMLHAGTDARLRSVTPPLGFGQRLVAIPLLMDLALHSTLLQGVLDLLRTVGTVGMQLRIHFHMIFVPIESLLVLLRPTRLGILLTQLRRILFPIVGNISLFDRLIL